MMWPVTPRSGKHIMIDKRWRFQAEGELYYSAKPLIIGRAKRITDLLDRKEHRTFLSEPRNQRYGGQPGDNVSAVCFAITITYSLIS